MQCAVRISLARAGRVIHVYTSSPKRLIDSPEHPKTHPHTTVLGAFLKLDTQLVESLDGTLEAVDCDGDMAESTMRLFVTVVVLELGVVLCQVSNTIGIESSVQ